MNQGRKLGKESEGEKGCKGGGGGRGGGGAEGAAEQAANKPHLRPHGGGISPHLGWLESAIFPPLLKRFKLPFTAKKLSRI